MGATLCGFGQISLKCLWTAKKKRKRQVDHSHQRENRHQKLLKETSKNEQDFVTLKEWILASPSIDFQGSKQSSNKVYPSLGRFLSYNSTNIEVTYQKNKSSNIEVEGREREDVSICKSQSGKLKKRVSFRQPEVADVFILDSEAGDSDH